MCAAKSVAYHLSDRARIQGEAPRPTVPSYRYYFSGLNQYSYFEALSKVALEDTAAGGMVNIRCAHQPKIVQAYFDFPDVPLVVDSGAFQQNDFDTYVEQLRGLRSVFRKRTVDLYDRIEWVANIDVIGNQQRSTTNWLELRDVYGFETLWVYQYGDDNPPTTIDQFLIRHCEERPPIIGVGGLVPMLNSSTSMACRAIEKIGQRLSKKGLKAHFFGVGSRQILSKFGAAEWFASADSQKWLAGKKARYVLTGDGRTMHVWKTGRDLAPRECALENCRTMLEWLRSTPHEQPTLFQQSAHTYGTCT